MVGRTSVGSGESEIEFSGFLFYFEGREHVDARITPDQVEFAVDEFQENDLGVLDDVEDDAVGIRELIARCVYFPVVGVALIDDALSPNPFDGDPGGDAGDAGLQEQLRSGGGFAKGVVIGFGIVFGVQGRQDVFWRGDQGAAEFVEYAPRGLGEEISRV